MKKEYQYKYWGKFWDEFEFIIEKNTKINGNSQIKKSKNNNQKALELLQKKEQNRGKISAFSRKI